ncbi:hypothetical protein EVAR_78220_1 [Eumeta japonica]|uniref:Uncharacterized protein n=1 Tax=Eumeta variegata TaxID=151549 RepID=A0A4C1T3V4_EUMVA|nr:hypothetical protein EVAR_78220_1 [Eumeta japonica]
MCTHRRRHARTHRRTDINREMLRIDFEGPETYNNRITFSLSISIPLLLLKPSSFILDSYGGLAFVSNPVSISIDSNSGSIINSGPAVNSSLGTASHQDFDQAPDSNSDHTLDSDFDIVLDFDTNLDFSILPACCFDSAICHGSDLNETATKAMIALASLGQSTLALVTNRLLSPLATQYTIVTPPVKRQTSKTLIFAASVFDDRCHSRRSLT